MLKHYWQDLLPETALQTAAFHYLEGKIAIDLKLPLSFSKQNDLEAKLKKIIEAEKSITTIKIFYYK